MEKDTNGTPVSTRLRKYAAFRLMRRPDDPDVNDTMQKLNIRTLNKWQKAIRHPSPERWLFATLRNICLESLREQGRFRPFPDGDCDQAPMPVPRFVPGYVQEDIEDCLRKLRDELRQVIIKTFWCGMTVTQMARDTGENKFKLFSRRSKALKLLRSCLTRKGYDSGSLY